MFKVIDLKPDYIIYYQGLQDVRARCADPTLYRADNSGWRISDTVVNPKIWHIPNKSLRAVMKFGLLIKQLALIDRVTRTNKTKHPYSDKKTYNIPKNSPIYFKRNIQSIIEIAKINNIKVILSEFNFDCDYNHHLFKHTTALKAFYEHNRILRSFDDNKDVFTYDFYGKPVDFIDGRHFTIKGHQQFAEYLKSFIRQVWG